MAGSEPHRQTGEVGALLSGAGLTVALSIQIMGVMEGYPVIFRAVTLTIIILVGVGAICLLAYRKGRPCR